MDSSATGQTPAKSLLPLKIDTGMTWSYVTTGDNFSLGFTTDDDLYSWGDNGYGQLGIGGWDDSNDPVLVDLY